MKGKVHIVGLGLAGLSAATNLAEKGHVLRLYEAAKVAGGRCRSFHDAKLDCLIDNGNHLMMSGNTSVLAFLHRVGAQEELILANEARFPFVDLKSGERWAVTLNDGRVPLWAFRKKTAVPGVRLGEYLSVLKLAFASKTTKISEITSSYGKLYERFWEPMTWAVLNTTPEKASAQLMWAVFQETFARGGEKCRPMIARRGLSETFVAPSLAYLSKKPVEHTFNQPLKSILCENSHVTALEFADHTLSLKPNDRVVLALPRAVLQKLLPEITVPDGDATIVNAHFKLAAALPEVNAIPLIGLVHAKTHWIFTRGNIISLTISAADALGLDRLSEEELLPELWREVVAALNLPRNLPYQAGRIIRERRATFEQSPESVAKRPPTRTAMKNLYLAGDWVDTGLPATIEGAIRSGEMAANAIMEA